MATNTTSEECATWFQKQAKICQERAAYIRQAWAKKEAEKQARQEAIQQAEQARKQADERFNQLLATMRAWQDQHSTPPAPHEAPKEEANSEENTEITAEKQEQEPLYQATVEDDMECTTKHGNSMLTTKSTLSTIPRLCTIPASRDPAACLSNAFFTHQHALNPAYQHALILGLMLNTRFGYIEHSESMEATGQG